MIGKELGADFRWRPSSRQASRHDTLYPDATFCMVCSNAEEPRCYKLIQRTTLEALHRDGVLRGRHCGGQSDAEGCEEENCFLHRKVCLNHRESFLRSWGFPSSVSTANRTAIVGRRRRRKLVHRPDHKSEGDHSRNEVQVVARSAHKSRYFGPQHQIHFAFRERGTHPANKL